MALVSKLRPVGNSKGIILPQDVLDQMNWAPDAEVEMKVQGSTLILVQHKVRTATDEEFSKAKGRVFKQHSRLMKNLAKR